MKKTLIHTLIVTKQGEKVQLQIKLPRDTKSVQAIKITTNGFPKKPSDKKEVGWLWLRIPEQRDVFFAEVLKVPFQEFDKVSFVPLSSLSFGVGYAWVDGGKETTFSVVVETGSTLIEGYYTDQLKTDLNGSYTVKIYLTLET